VVLKVDSYPLLLNAEKLEQISNVEGGNEIFLQNGNAALFDRLITNQSAVLFSEQTSNQLAVLFLLEQISINHQPNEYAVRS
jgi:hypothetical protein